MGMKIFATILSIYVLVLTSMPCIDKQDNTLQKTELSGTSSDNHQKDCDHCSPFCTCYCCASPVLSQTSAIQFNVFFIAQHIPGENVSKYFSSIFSSIWQPPKIS
jgi:hypothetical protein